ncbi:MULTISPECIES: LuxR C-terminal-related transcriptional regulator [Kribbella]|uniref:ATP/maltotriose-dependent transcriptional regulator MalT n=1 Tax=Kribbella pratensis TaxID=2512112 RepID=A0ABY2F7J2_9ACTN|nr:MULTISPECIES: LuxR C-terminal-related transcriptional regulator [Kribbella]TDW79576.1 ATP/maltotriose-dependent transcriptional regulator MalT [Kribbella sp. VKM Ac-2566]TDW84265.1 ATP/maltotriose-dependent transcriptional regulator MalT [Kribbella pratensis]
MGSSSPTPEQEHDDFRVAASGGIPWPPLTLVTRERLHSALDLGVRAPLTMLVAPAGTGKTVLLSDWVARRRRSGEPVMWVSGQSPGALTESLQHVIGGDVPSLPDPIVVDDAHLLPAAMVADVLQVLRKSPHAVRLVLATRYDLPLPVSELELRGMALTLRSRDLRFTDAEATALVQAHASEATGEDIELFQTHTAGWAAALVLAARAFAASGVAVWPPANQRPVLDLLLGESLSTLGDRVQAMLLSTFGPGSVTGPQAVMLSGDPDAGAMLAELAGNGLLVTAYVADPGGEPLYRYHPLLVELLRRRAAASADDARLVVAAQRRSALYYENRGDGATALRSALGAADPEFVARIVLGHGPEILAAGELDLVTAGFDALPDGYLADHPHLIGVRGLLRRVSGDVAGAVMDTASADDLAGAMNPVTPDDDALAADAVLLRLWESRYGWYDVHAAIDRARNLLAPDSADGDSRHTVLAPERLAWLLIELAAAETWADDLDAALAHLDEALVTARMAGHPGLVAGGLAHRAIVQHVRGQMQNAAQSAQAALDVVDDRLPQVYAVRAQLVLGFAALNQLDLARAWSWYERVVETDLADSDTVVTALRSMLRSVLLIEAGRLDDASTELTRDPAAAGPLPSFLSRDLALLRFRLAILIGDQAGVDLQVRELDRSGNATEAELIRALLSLGQGDPRATVRLIDRVLEGLNPHPPVAAAAASFRTVLLGRLGDRPAAEASLVDTLNRVTPQRNLHALVPAGAEPVFLDLLRSHLAGPNPQPFAAAALEQLSAYLAAGSDIAQRTLLARTRPDAHMSPPRRLDATVNGARIRLTAREADVLDQLALGNSYSEIAQALYITENTVKTHLMALYRKLGVEKRSAALRVARDVGLV